MTDKEGACQQLLRKECQKDGRQGRSSPDRGTNNPDRGTSNGRQGRSDSATRKERPTHAAVAYK